MARAERFPRTWRSSTRAPHRMRILAAAVTALQPLCVAAQAAPPAASPRDVRYTAPTASERALYPDQQPPTAPGATAAAGAASAGPATATVQRVVVEVERNAVAADGHTAVKIRVRLFDAAGHPPAVPAMATIEHSGGRILLAGGRTDEFGPRRLDADKATPGVQIKVEGGAAEFSLIAPAEAQDVRLRVTSGAQEASGVISFVPEMRDMIAAGLIEGVLNFHRRGVSVIQPVRSNDGFDQQIQAWSRAFSAGKANMQARTAFYLKGTVSGEYLLTATYDSDKETRARLLSAVQPDQMYPVYGDSSLRSFDARSAGRLYVRLDKNKNYLLYGDFVTGDGFTQPMGQGEVASLKQRSLGGYNRTASGVRVHHEQGQVVGNVFVFNDTLRQVVDEFASQGSGPYALRNTAVLEGSEKVEVLVRDRAQPSAIVSVRALQRLVDYTFEPFTGRILLASFLPAVDANLNPTTLRVTYEVDQGGTPFRVGGADAQFKLTDRFEVGGNAVSDRNPLAPYELQSANATWRAGPRSAVVVEAARTVSTVNTNPANQTVTPALALRSGEVAGTAWRVEAAHEDEANKVRLFAGRTAPTFNNPSAPLNGGRAEANGKATHKLTATVTAYVEGQASEDLNAGGGKHDAAGAGLRWKATDRLTLDAGLRIERETIGAQGNGRLTMPSGSTNGLTSSLGSGAGGGAVGFGNQAIDPASGLPIISQGSLANAFATLPQGTRLESRSIRLGAGYRLTERFRLGAQVDSETSGDARRRGSVGGDYQWSERTQLYGRYEHQSGWVDLGGVSGASTKANAFVLGVSTSYWKDTQAFSEYRMRDAISSQDLQLASGILNNWDLSTGLRLSTGYEHLKVLSGKAAPSDALTAGLEYTANPLWKASTRVELRRSGDIAATPDNDAFTTTLWQATVARKMARDWTLLARNYTLLTRYANRGDVLQDRAQIGLAYRDTDTNRLNALGMIERKLESDASRAEVGDLRSAAWIVSAHADVHASRPWWITGRIAAKWQNDQLQSGARDSFKSALMAGRVVYDLSENWDVGVLAAVQSGQGGARQTAYGAEVGYLLKQNLWLSLGANLAGFRGDSDLTGYEYTRRGVYLRLRFKFDEDLLRGNNPDVNRALTRVLDR